MYVVVCMCMYEYMDIYVYLDIRCSLFNMRGSEGRARKVDLSYFPVLSLGLLAFNGHFDFSILL